MVLEQDIIDNIDPNEYTCNINSTNMYKKLKTGNKIYILFNNPNDFAKFIVDNVKDVCNIEIRVTSKDIFIESEKLALAKKYNIERYVYGKYLFSEPYLKLFTHGFNIYHINNKYVIAQSWKNIHSYKIIYRFNKKQFIDFINLIRKGLILYRKDPYKIHHLFGIYEMTDYKLKVLDMITRVDFDFNIEIKCYC